MVLELVVEDDVVELEVVLEDVVLDDVQLVLLLVVEEVELE